MHLEIHEKVPLPTTLPASSSTTPAILLLPSQHTSPALTHNDQSIHPPLEVISFVDHRSPAHQFSASQSLILLAAAPRKVFLLLAQLLQRIDHLLQLHRFQ